MQISTYFAEVVLVMILGDTALRFSELKIHLKTKTPSLDINPITPNAVPMMNVKTIITLMIIQKQWRKNLKHWILQQQP